MKKNLYINSTVSNKDYPVIFEGRTIQVGRAKYKKLVPLENFITNYSFTTNVYKKATDYDIELYLAELLKEHIKRDFLEGL